MRKIVRKIILLSMAVCLGLSCLYGLAGCGKIYPTKIDWNVDLSKPIDLNLLFPYTGMANFGSDHTAQLIQGATGYKVNYSQVSDGNGDNDINKVLSDGKSSYNAMKLTLAQYDPHVISKTWLDLTELLEKTESGKILYELIDLVPEAWDSVTYTDDDGKKHIYGIPECGYTSIEEFALIWNKEHLKAIGWYDNHTDVPESIGEITTAFNQLQAKYSTNKDYHAFGLGGVNFANVENIMAAFGVPNQFYVDDNGDIQFYIYNESVTNYSKYMNKLKKDAIISDSWQTSSPGDACLKFSTQLSSCVYLPYWWVKPLCNTSVSNKLASVFGKADNYKTVHNEVIGWRTRVRGDGTNGSENQEKAKYISDNIGAAFMTVIPSTSAKNAVYTIDYLSKKLQTYALWYGGKEGVDWNVIDEPADKQEDYENKIIYMQPWSYTLSGKTVEGGGKWIQLTQSYMDNIVDNSMYATGANVAEAISLFHLRETGFDGWQIAVDTDDTIIRDPITTLHPTFKWWSPVSINSRTTAKRGIASAISVNGDAGKVIDEVRESLKNTRAKVGGVNYFYWSDKIVKEMTDWYKAVKLKN